MTGRLPYRNKKLVRSRRLSQADSSDDSEGGAESLDTPTQPGCSRRADMSDGGAPFNSSRSASTKWKRASVRAVQIQESRKQKAAKSAGNGSLPRDSHEPLTATSDSVRVQCEPSQPASDPFTEGAYSDPFADGVYVEPQEETDELDGGSINLDPKDLESLSHGSETESIPSISSHSSLLVDMGKVVGVLRSCPARESDDQSDYDLKEEPEVCLNCEREALGDEGEEGEEEFLGDPLVYATFVAPIQQYSTETDSSRQHSFNSRQPSFNSRQPSFNSRQPSFNSRQPSFNSVKQSSVEADCQPEVCSGPTNSLIVPTSKPNLPGQTLSVPGQPGQPPGHTGQVVQLPSHHQVLQLAGGPGQVPGQQGQVVQVQGHPGQILLVPVHQAQTNHSGEYKPEVSCGGSCGMDGWNGETSSADCMRCDGGQVWAGNQDPAFVVNDPECVTSQQLNQQLSQERMSFIHSQSSREDDPDYDNLPLPAPPPPPQQVPLPIPPPPKSREATPSAASQGSSLSLPGCRQQERHWGSGEESDGDHASTIKRKSKRDRNKTATSTLSGTDRNCQTHSLKKNKSRSKSRSPGREIDRAIVIVHHTTCSHGSSGRSQNASPDNLSESSISFHENEVISDISPNSVPRSVVEDSGGLAPILPVPPVWYDGPVDPCVSVSRDPPSTTRTDGRNFQYSNWESCRESWFSSGSDCPRPSSGSDCPPQPTYTREKEHAPVVHPSTLPKSGGRGSLTTSTIRQSSKESGSSSSRQSSRAGIRSTNRTHSPKLQRQGVKGKLHSKVEPSRDSTPTESIGSSLQSGQSLQRLDLDQVVGVADLVNLEPLSEEAVLENLHSRFKQDQIYTWASTVLLSVNSYKKLSLYTPEVIDAYRSQPISQLPPHIYCLADRAWHSLRDRGEDQAVLLTGESGSGKTEAGKLVLQYIAAVTHHSAEFHNIKYQLLQSNPVLEAFGNAKTLHNDNSSRFGKYLEVSFDFKGDPTGGFITNYLLEKTRVTNFGAEERNFHIFYQLLSGADIHTLKELKLQRNLDSYQLLRSSCSQQLPVGQSKQSSVTDRRDFHITRKALEDLGFTNEETLDLLKLVSTVLKLGNLTFIPTTNMDGTEGCAIGNEYELYEIASLLEADAGQLRSALLARSTSLHSESVVSELSAGEARDSRDRLCRTTYSRLFTWLVSRINAAIKVKTHKKHKILGILDIYGFEAFENNGFEQFIINFCNEKIQQVFIDWTFRREQMEIISDGLQWNQIGYFSNCVICSLIERSSHGILAQLDQASNKLGEHGLGHGASFEVADQEFLQGLDESFSCHPHYEASSSPSPSPQENPVPAHSFRIKHYAGSVTYNVSGFLAKNCDSLDPSLSRVMFAANHSLVKTLFPEGNGKRGVRRRPATVGTQFKISLGALLTNIGAKSPHFVRCIKPNESKTPRSFDSTLVQHQIRYLGILELIRLRCSGFVARESYDTFLERYKMLSTRTWPSWQGSSVEGVTYLLRDLPLSASEYVFGRSKIFIRSMWSVDQLEEWRRERVEELVVLIQKIWRGWVARRNWWRLRDSQIVISNCWKRWKDKSHIIELKQRKKQEWAVLIIQKHYRTWQRKRWLLSLANSLPSESPSSRDWPRSPTCLRQTSFLLRKIYHRWRCGRFRDRFDQTSRNRMREKVTASLIFKEKKSSYPRSVRIPFHGDYVGLRRNPQWKDVMTKNHLHKMDRYVVFADIVNKINRSNGKFVPILFVISTSSMLILDQRTMQIKYRVPAGEIFKLSLSPFFDDIAVFHVRASSPTREMRSQANIPGCLSSEAVKRKGDFVFQTGHVIEIVTKLFLVVQNSTGKPPAVNISTEFDANFGTHNVTFQFKCTGDPSVAHGHVKLLKKGNKMEVVL